jgi:hypothetical protein
MDDSPLVVVGFDPDMDGTAAACLIEHQKNIRIHRLAILPHGPNPVKVCSPLHAFLEAVTASLPTPVSVFCIEGQNIAYTARQGARPTDLLKLGIMTGAFLGLLGTLPEVTIMHPQPFEWKGQQPKKINQGRTYTRLCMKYTITGGRDPRKQFCVPVVDEMPDEIFSGKLPKRAEWRHLGDAIGIALYAIDETRMAQSKKRMVEDAAPKTTTD